MNNAKRIFKENNWKKKYPNDYHTIQLTVLLKWWKKKQKKNEKYDHI